MAPELIVKERGYTNKVDIWSLGIFALELANGQPPYIELTPIRIVFNIIN